MRMEDGAKRRGIGLCPLLLILLVACASQPAPVTPAPQRLPTRAPTPTPTATPFAIAARSYYEEGLSRQGTGDAEGALQSFTWAIERQSDFAPLYVARGTVYLGLGELDRAMADADTALQIDPTAEAYALRGEALRRMGRAEEALEALERALELDPTLREDTFRSRWLLARSTEDAPYMLVLSREYSDAHPQDPLRHYYRSWANLELDVHKFAAATLVRAINSSSESPALLWFTLGRIYEAKREWSSAITAFETARMLTQNGDDTLALHTDRPIIELFSALGQAYLEVGRCVDAEIVLSYAESIGAHPSEYIVALEKARFCQTPTPTPTATPYPSWLLSGP